MDFCVTFSKLCFLFQNHEQTVVKKTINTPFFSDVKKREYINSTQVGNRTVLHSMLLSRTAILCFHPLVFQDHIWFA